MRAKHFVSGTVTWKAIPIICVFKGTINEYLEQF